MPKDKKYEPFSEIVEKAIEEAEPAAEWLRTHPPGARLPDELEPGYHGEGELADFDPDTGRSSWDDWDND